MGDYHITIRGGRWFLITAAVLLFCLLSAAAFLVYLFVAHDPLSMIHVRVKLEKQYMKARMEGSFPVTAEVDQRLRLPLKETIAVGFPFNQRLTVPFNQTMEIPVELDAVIPIRMTVPFNADIPINTEVYVDTTVQTSVMGVPLTVPIKGYVPVQTIVPVSQNVEVREDFHLRLQSPVKVNIQETFIIPIEMLISAQIPLDTTLNLNLKEQFLADISFGGPLDNQIPNLYILDNTLDIKLDRIRLVLPD